MTVFSKDVGVLTTKDLDITIEDGFLIDDDNNIFLRRILEKHPSVPFKTFVERNKPQVYWLTENNYLAKEVLEKYKEYLHRNYRGNYLYWWTGAFYQGRKARIQDEDGEIVPILFSVKILEENEIFFRVRQNVNSIYGFDITVNTDEIRSKKLLYQNQDGTLSYFTLIYL